MKAKRNRKRSAKNKKVGSRSLVLHRLENISKEIFKRYYSLITELIGSSPGIYALYDGTELYYLGKSTDLRKRVRHHLRDRHLASWTHFSLYLVRRAAHIHEIESLLIRIANPKGNRIIPKGKMSGKMVKKLRAMVKEKQKQELQKMFGRGAGESKKFTRKATPSNRQLKGLVSKRAPLFRTYKGKEYKAVLTPGGTIKLGNKRFTSLTAAAKAVVDRKTVNGWTFWYIKDSHGDWVRLTDYKG